MELKPPVRFDECPICEKIPRKLFQFHCGSHDQPEVPQHYFPSCLETEMLVDAAKPYWLHKCPRCWTYYKYDQLDRGWPTGSLQSYLYRLTPPKVRAQLDLAHVNEVAREELAWLDARFSGLLECAKALIESPRAYAREYAAETLADRLKAAGVWDGVRWLLKHEDSRVRYGALLSFESLQFCAIDVGFKPLVDDFIGALADPDPDVSWLASALLGKLVGKEEKQVLRKLRKIPPEKQSAECKKLRLSLSDSAQEMVECLADPDGSVRMQALSALYQHSYYFHGEVPAIRDMIGRTAEAERTAEMAEFLAEKYPWNRAFPEDDD